MILITGAAGFIASNLLASVNQKFPDHEVVIIDDFSKLDKELNYIDCNYVKKMEREHLFQKINEFAEKIEVVFHLGARTDTLSTDVTTMYNLNFEYSKSLFRICDKYKIPLIYASSAATYGDGSIGFDDMINLDLLHPLNPYACSKHDFDLYVKSQGRLSFPCYGLKFFNVFGANESHKGNMQSMVAQIYRQVKSDGKVKLFKSYKAEFLHGEQRRDFIYVNDVIDVCLFFFENLPDSGIYNVGTAKAVSFNALAKTVFSTLKKEVLIEYIDMPSDLQSKYQYVTEATNYKLRSIGYDKPFTSLTDSIADYIFNYLER